MIIHRGIIYARMLVINVVGKVVPIAAGILVVRGLRITREGVVHQYFPVTFSFRELPGAAAGGDGVSLEETPSP